MRTLVAFAGAVAALSALTTLPALAADPGAEVFAEVCTACHGAAGEGTPGIAPPLNDPPFWEKLGDRAPEFVRGVLLSGFSGTIESQGQSYFGLVMPSHAMLTDDQLSAVATYVLKTYGGSEATLAPKDFADARATPPSHAELMKLRNGEGG